MPATMMAAIFIEPNRIALDEKPVPDVGPLDALIRITTTTICGTDIHILKGEHPVCSGRTIGHEPVGIIEKLGSGVTRFREGQRVIAAAVAPSGRSNISLCGFHAQCSAGAIHGWKPIDGWWFGNTIDGAQAEYLLVPNAMDHLAPVPDSLTDEQVLMCPDIMSTGLGGAESSAIRIGDTVAVFAQCPLGLCATAGAKLMGAARIIAVETIPERMAMARRMGADYVVDFNAVDPVDKIMRITGWRGVDVVIDALGAKETFDAALRVLRPGGTLTSLGIHANDVRGPPESFPAQIGEHRIVTTLCPGGNERMRRLMEVIAAGRIDTRPLVTHRFKLADIERAYDLLSDRRDGVIKIAITP